MRAPNHPLVRVRAAGPAGQRHIQLDVAQESAHLSYSEALRLHTDLETILVALGCLAPRELPHVL